MGRVKKGSGSGMDTLARLVLGTGVLLSAAAAGMWLLPARSPAPTPTPAPPPEARIPPVAESRSAAPAASTDGQMAAFFAALPRRAPESVPSWDRFAGTWTATIVSVDVEGDQAPIRDARGLAPFRFTIAAAGGEWRMAAADGRGLARTLVAEAGGVVARGDGAPDVRLSLHGNRIVGFIAAERPAKGRIEFHALKE